MEKNLKNFVFGRRNVAELLKRKIPPSQSGIKRVFTKTEPSRDFQREILSKFPTSTPIQYLSRKELDELLPKNSNHQGIIVELEHNKRQEQYKNFGDFKNFVESPTKGFVLVLDRIQDAGNMGNILRTAECFGIQNVVIPEREQVKITEAVIRASSGAVHHLNIYRVANIKQAIEVMKKNGYWIIASSDSGNDSWENLPSTKNLGLIIGNEHNGIKKILLENSDYILKIPINGNTSSLNAGVACGIFLDRLINRRIN